MGEVPLQIKVGGIHANIGSVMRSPDMKQALAEFLRALADEIDGGEPGGESQDQTEPQGSAEAPAG